MPDKYPKDPLPLEDPFSTIIEQSPFSIQVISPDGFTKRVNQAWEELWGVKFEQIKDYNILEDEQLEKKGVMPYIKRAFEGHFAEIPPIVYDPEETIPGVTADPDPKRWTKAVIYPIKNSEGKVQEVVLMHEDITDQKLTEESIKSSELRYRMLFETSLDGIMIVDERGTYVDVNESMCEILKASRQQLIGTHFSQHMVPERIMDAQEAFLALRNKGTFTGDFPMLAADGSIVELTWTSRANFMPGLHVCVARNITERKQAEEALRQSEAKYRNLLENANDIIYSHDLEGKYLSINKAGEKITGYTQEEVLAGMNVGQLVVPEHLELAKQMTRQKLLDPQPTIYEIDIFTKDGRRLTLEVSTRISFQNEKPVAVEGIARDITERKRVEKEKAQLGERIENQRKHLQEMVSNIPGVVWETWGAPDSALQRIDFVSDYVERILGYSIDEWLSTPNFWLKIVHPEDQEGAAQRAAETFAGKTTGTNQFRWVTKDGRVIWVEAQSVVIRDENGNPIGMRGVTMDISERKKKEDNDKFLTEVSSILASSLEYETTLASVARIAVPRFSDWCTVDIADENGHGLHRLVLSHVDPEKCQWAEEMNKKYPPDPAATFGLYNVFRTGQTEFYPEIPEELILKGARSEEHLEILRKVAVKSAIVIPLKLNDRVLGVITFANSEPRESHREDDLILAERLASRAALAIENAKLYESQKQARAKAERTSDLLARLQKVSLSLSQALTPQQVARAVMEQGFNIIRAHAGIVALFNETRAQLEMIDTINIPPQILDQWNQFSQDIPIPLNDAIHQRAPIIIESFEGINQQYPVPGPLMLVEGSQALVALPLIVEEKIIGAMGLSFPEPQKFSADDQTFMLALADQCGQALERAHLYEVERNLRAEAEKASRLKDEFLATVSHELRTPLNAILGWSGMLRNGRLDSQATIQALETVERNAHSQVQLIDDLLDISRIITGKLRLNIQTVDLMAVINSAVEVIRPSAEAKKIKLQLLLDPSAGPISGDPDRLQQIIWNLLSNAIKFTPKDGQVQIRLEQINSHIEITVSDNGEGIEAEFIPYIFDRFRQADQTTTRRQGGLGLGLSIVHQLVEMHGGAVQVTSAGKGTGTTFTVKFPRLSLTSTSEREKRVHPTRSEEFLSFDNAPDLTGVKALVVDDEIDSRELLRAVLELCQTEVTTANSAAEALEYLKKDRFDVLVSDIGMPDEDGYTLIKKIRELPPEAGGLIPAIALTAYARVEDRVRALTSGFQMHIPKPVEPIELIAVIAGLVKGVGNSEIN